MADVIPLHDSPPPADELVGAHLQNLLHIATRDFTAEQLAAARQSHREWMRERGQGDPMAAAALRLREINGTPAGTVRARALIAYAADAIRDEGRADRGDVPTMDAPAGDVTTGKDRKKGRKGAKSASGPKKSKRATGWVKKIGSSAAGYRVAPAIVVDDAKLLAMLNAGGFRRRAEEIRKEPAWGWCPVTDASGSTAEIISLPTIGSDPDWVIFGLRCDKKTGCPTFRFRAEAEAQATNEARGEGKINATGARIREITDGLVDRWYATATPQTVLVPCAWHRTGQSLYVFSDSAEAQARAVELAATTLGKLERRPGLLDGMPTDLAKTNLRSSDGLEKGNAVLGADLLTWIVGRTLAGVARTRVGIDSLASDPHAEGELEYWVEDGVELIRGGGDTKKLGIKLAGAATDSGSLPAALADGAEMKAARITLKFAETRWTLALGQDATPKGWRLQCETKPDGTDAGLDAAIDERLRLWRRGEDLLSVLVTAYRHARTDRGTWRQHTGAIQREVVARLGATRDGFAAQIPLFGVEQLAAGNAETTSSRGRRAREQAAAAAGECP